VATLSGLCVAAFWIIAVSIGVGRAREAARRTQCYGSYKGLHLAILNAHDSTGRYPAARTSDEEGRRSMSWRVSILPWLDSQALLDDYDATKAWDDPANASVRSRRFSYYGCPSQEAAPGESTHKAAVAGAGTVFPGTEPMRLDDVPDGMSNTVWAGEISFPLSWTTPEDVDAPAHLTLDGPRGFSGPHDGVPFAFCDGSSRFLSRNTDPDVLRRLFLRGDETAAEAEGDGAEYAPPNAP
jgi:hypothetical protein